MYWNCVICKIILECDYYLDLESMPNHNLLKLKRPGLQSFWSESNVAKMCTVSTLTAGEHELLRNKNMQNGLLLAD